MYHFAIVALMGLALWKTVGFIVGLLRSEPSSSTKTLLTLGLGVVAVTAADYSMFAGWGVSFRYDWIGPVFTGLIVGSMAYVWHHVLGFVEAYGRRSRDEARDLERRAPHAA